MLIIPAASCASDEYEPNNDITHATSIDIPFSADLTLCPEGDQDYFRLRVSRVIDVTFEIGCGDDPALIRV